MDPNVEKKPGNCILGKEGELFNDYPQSAFSFIGSSYPVSFDVEMFEYCFSKDTPIMTSGAGPCLIIIVHNPTNNSGCLAHLACEPGEWEARYRKALAVTKLLIKECSSPAGADIFLIGGWAYQKGNKTFNDKNACDIEEYFQKNKGELVGNHTIKREEPYPVKAAQALYDPIKNKVYLLGDQEFVGLRDKYIRSYDEKSPCKKYDTN